MTSQHSASPNEVPEVYGAAPERTVLAWQRSGLGVVVGCLLTFNTAFRLGVLAAGVAAVMLGLVVAAVSVSGFPVGRHLRRDAADSLHLLVLISVAVVALAVVATVVAVVALM